jgi:hypothetical protein
MRTEAMTGAQDILGDRNRKCARRGRYPSLRRVVVLEARAMQKK